MNDLPKYIRRLLGSGSLAITKNGGAVGRLTPLTSRPILREAVPHHVVRGLVALDAERRAREIDGQRDRAVDAQHDGRQQESGTHVHVRTRVSRNDRSSVRMPFRCVGRETWWSIS